MLERSGFTELDRSVRIPSLVELLRWRAAQEPETLAYAFLKDGIAPEQELTYGALDHKARVLAGWLQANSHVGDRALLLYSRGLDVIVAFWACLYAGVIAIPAPPPDPVRARQSLPRLKSIVQDAQVRLVLSSREVMDAFLPHLRAVGLDSTLQWCDSAGVEPEWVGRWNEYRPPEDGLAYLQYTSGSTSDPKGVMLTHANLLRHSEMLSQAAACGDDCRSLTWLPYYHDYGLVHGVIVPVFLGSPSYLMSPVAFLKQPLRWLEAISRHRITHSGGPNFAYDYCVRAEATARGLELDLSSWRVASCGAEPIRASTIKAFLNAFQGYGLRAEAFAPAYGMAEYTLLVSMKATPLLHTVMSMDARALERGEVVASKESDSPIRPVVGCGAPIGDTKVAIVEPATMRRCAPDRVGEVWLAGRSMAQGYWNRPEETAQTFGAILADTGEGPFLRTGDLGFIKDGQVFITGRLKDLIIVRGRNHYPQDLERTVEEAHHALRAGGGAAFSIDEDGEEHVVVLQEVLRNVRSFDCEEIAANIREAVAAQHELQVYEVVLIKAGSLPKTSSGKVQRRASRDAYLSGLLTVVGRSRFKHGASVPAAGVLTREMLLAMPAEARVGAIAQYLQQLAAGALSIPSERVSLQHPLTSLGLDSLAAVQLRNRVEEALGVSVSLSTLLENTSLEQLANRMGADLGDHVQSVEASTRASESPAQLGVHSASIPSECAMRPESIPLSFAQERVWFLQQLEPGNPFYNVPMALRLSGPLDVALAEQCLREILQRHESLRTTFPDVSGTPHQVIAASSEWSIPFVDLLEFSEDRRQEEWRRIEQETLALPFDLAQGPLKRGVLARFSAEDHLLLLCIHHIIMDGWSAGVLLREWCALYQAGCAGTRASLMALPLQPADVAIWERRRVSEASSQHDMAYWTRQLAGAPPQLDLPTDRPKPVRRRYRGTTYTRVLPRDLIAALKVFSVEQGATRFMIVLTAVVSLLSRYTGQTDIVVGSTAANRHRVEAEPLIGMFVNILALRVDLTGNPAMSDLLQRVRKITLEAYDHQAASFDHIVEALHLEREGGQTPLIRVMIAWEPSIEIPKKCGEITCTRQDIGSRTALFDITFFLRDHEEGLQLTAEYDTDLFDEETVARLVRHLEVIVAGVIANPNLRLSELPLLTGQEQRQLVEEWNRTEQAYPSHQCAHQLIEHQARQSPDETAICSGECRLTYRELTERADHVAGLLRDLSVRPGQLVGLYAERSVNMVVGMLGIWKAGGAYVPVDPMWPEVRRSFMLQDAHVTVVVAEPALSSKLDNYRGVIVKLDDCAEPSAPAGTGLQGVAISPDSPAYAIYTSGSTGNPKGVEMSHRCLVNLAAWQRARSSSRGVRRTLQFASMSFDVSVQEILSTLCSGGTLFIATDEVRTSSSALLTFLARHQIERAFLPPVAMHHLVDAAVSEARSLPHLKEIICAGESLVVSPAVRQFCRLCPGCVLENQYGPTESHVVTAWTVSTPPPLGPVPIGRPIANARVYLLDGEMQLVPVGAVGEVYIGGPCLARGYVYRPDLTAERFHADPFVPGERLYRTGDLARYRPDGVIEFIGRRDHQIKLRGYRIELGEIERVLGTYPEVEQAVVCLREDAGAQPRLVAYIKSRTGESPSGAQIKAFLAERLPGYMVPATFAWMEQFPLTGSGKIDRRALPAPSEMHHPERPVGVAPRSPIEASLAEMWKSVLKIRSLGVHDQFFELGGHSLLATQVASRIRETFGVSLPLRLLFEKTTIAELAEEVKRARTQGQSGMVFPPITRTDRDLPVPLSFSQQRMWFMQQLAPDGTAYNMPAAMKLSGRLNRSALAHALAGMAQRHESFRTTFAVSTDGPVQLIRPAETPTWEEVDLRLLPESSREEEAARVLAQESARPFDLVNGPVARYLLIQVGEQEHILLLHMHHIIGDQWSFAIIAREFTGLYNEYCHGRTAVAAPATIQYADFAVWQRRWLTDDVLLPQLVYWRKQLAGLHVLALPTDSPRPQVQRFTGSYRALDLSEGLLATLRHVSARRGCTLFMTLLAAFKMLLGRYAGQDDVAVGVPIASRTRLSTEGIIGTFVNTLVMRTDLSGNPTFDALLQRVRETALGAFDHQDLPFERLVAELDRRRDQSYSPLVQVLFNVANAPIEKPAFEGLAWEPFDFDGGAAQFDLTMMVDTEITNRALLSFRTDLYEGVTIESMLAQYRAILEAVAINSDKPIAEYQVLSQSDRRLMLEQWNATQAPYPATKTVAQLIAEQADSTPDAIAVAMDGQILTYQDLHGHSNRLSHHLRRLGIGRGDLIGVCLSRSPSMVVALLGIMKSGAAYVPLDPNFPPDRVAFMVEDSCSRVIVTSSDLLDRVPLNGRHAICLDRERDTIERESSATRLDGPGPEDVVYVMYTSGSTGKPKGVEISHRALVNFLWSMRGIPGCTNRDVLLSVTTLSFDIAGLELYLPLIVGGRVELVSRQVASDGRLLKKRVDDIRPTIMQATPATWRMLLDAGWGEAKQMTALCGGEALPRALADQLLPQVGALWNMYGPTETTIWSTLSKVEPAPSDITIGKPIANTQVYILDAARQPVPIGVPGELYIGGEGLAGGYRHRPELTAERFILNPFSEDRTARLYRTGDQARYLRDGRIVHLGRLDHQVKVRGFRIELGEIEQSLSAHPHVRQSVVVARPDQSGGQRLVAYVAPTAGQGLSIGDLRAHLRVHLPDYMIPSAFVPMEEFPLTANGKVDRLALPDPLPGQASAAAQSVLPTSPLEVQLTALWQQALGRSDVGIHDNFFELGGHSLIAVQLFANLEQLFGKQLPLATLFQAPTIAQLAEVLTRSECVTPWRSLVVIQPVGTALPIFAVPGVGGNVLAFARLAMQLGREQPFYGLQTIGLDGRQVPLISVREIASRYLEEIRSVRPEGPYIILGTCTGGVIAFEIAQQLKCAGQAVELLILESWHPRSFRSYRTPLNSSWRVGLRMAVKLLSSITVLKSLPVFQWGTFIRHKLAAARHMVHAHTGTETQDRDIIRERVSQATFHAVATYQTTAYAGSLLNIIASDRVLGEGVEDTRTVWTELAQAETSTVQVPAENSGRLFVSPHVEVVADVLRTYLDQRRQEATSEARHSIG